MGHRTSLTNKSAKLWKIFQMTKNMSKNILFALYLNAIYWVENKFPAWGIDKLKYETF